MIDAKNHPIKNETNLVGKESPTESPTEKDLSTNDLLNLVASREMYNANKDAIDKIQEDLQANIIKAAKHQYILYCFLRFKKGTEKRIVSWLKEMPLTSALELKTAEQETAISLMLSYQGYEFLCDEKRIEKLIPLENDEIEAFREGLIQRCPKAFGGDAQDDMEEIYKKPFHALILIASNDKILGDINDEVDEHQRQLSLLNYFTESTQANDSRKRFRNGLYGDVFFEIGIKNPEGDKGKAREWFGFRDGISNPRFLPDPEKIKHLNFRPDPPDKLNVVLLRNHLAPKPEACGSFVVFLKLEQNEAAFEDYTNRLAGELGIKEGYEGHAAALLIGREKDGTPVHKDFKYPSDDTVNLNAFDFRKDPDGMKCPFHAHIRKANPHDGSSYPKIVRRGRIYGSNKVPKRARGILFLSYQSSFFAFEDIINRGIYAFNYRGKEVGRDGLFMKKDKYSRIYQYSYSGHPPITPYLAPKEDFIKFKGGQYFFASAISFIRTNLENCM